MIDRWWIEMKWHGGWVLPPHLQVLEACAFLVCHRRFMSKSKKMKLKGRSKPRSRCEMR